MSDKYTKNQLQKQHKYLIVRYLTTLHPLTYFNAFALGYIGQLWKYLQVNKQKFKRIIIAGDFNSNAIWDEWDRWWNHSNVIHELNEIGIKSLYHSFTGEQQGKETKPTFYMNRKIHKPYHIDYIFSSNEFLNNLIDIRLFEVEDWIKISDHVPMICEF